jgi:uncharacterized protein (TIGR02453 family)
MPEPAFTGFPRATFTWFAGLEADNSKAWFAARRDTYDNAVRGELEALLEELADELGGRVKLFRQHRDTRFSKDKSPYKTRTYGAIDGRLYAEVASAGLFAGTGIYGFAPDQLERFRAAVADEETGTEIEAIVGALDAAGVETFGEALKVAPRGYPRDHPRAPLLRHKMLIAGARLAPDPATGAISRTAALTHAQDTWTACAPMNAWLDVHVGPSTLPPPPSRYGAGARRG